MTAPQVPRPRRRLTQAEFDAELSRAQDAHRAAHVPAYIERRPGDPETGGPPTHRSPYVARTGRRRSWWMRGWKR